MMMTEISEHTIGYGAVVLPALNEFQGFYLVDDPILHKDAVKAQMMALLAGPDNIIGALQATVVEGIVTKNFTLTGTAALALHGITKMKFFWIKATKEPGGTRTEMFPLKATTLEDAQHEVNHLPEVLAIKKRLRVEMMKPKSYKN